MKAIIFISSIVVLWFLFDRFVNRRHTINRNFPIIGWVRRLLESFGPELRQYIVANNREELPFNRTQRSWVYATSKMQDNLTGFGSDQDMSADGHVFVMHSHMPLPSYPHAKVVELSRKTRTCVDFDEFGNPYHDSPFRAAKEIGSRRRRPYTPNLVNISAMSYGALSPTAVKALNKGAWLAGSFHNTGEGGFHPELHGKADVVFQIGTGYFGCRNADGSFSKEKVVRLVQDNPNIRMIEIKLSQGAKPGKGGVLPGSKVNKHIAEARGIAEGQDAISPACHTAFNSFNLVDFIEDLAAATGLPVGIKSAVSSPGFWDLLFARMRETGNGPDFITIDGGEGGTGAAPASFAGHVALPFNDAFAKVINSAMEAGVKNRLFFIASAKLGFPEQVMKAMAMGADSVNVAREALLSIGCIQAQRCHTNVCPSGIATQNRWLYRGIDPDDKGARCANYLMGLMEETWSMAAACGLRHPSHATSNTVMIRRNGNLTPVNRL